MTDEEMKAKLEELSADHDEVEVHVIGGDVFFLRPPSLASVERWRAHMVDDAKRSKAGARLVQDSIVWPPPVELAAIFKRKPMRIEALLRPVCELAGMVDAEKKAL